MDRAAIKDCYALMTQVENALGGLPHRDAVPAIALLEDLRVTIGEDLPGGFFGYCGICGTVLGCDDNFASTEEGEWVCTTCCAEAAEEAHD